MYKVFSNANIGIWALIGIILVLYTGKTIGVDWGLTDKKAFGRLLIHSEIAFFQLGFAVTILIMRACSKVKLDILIVIISALAIIVSIYHIIYYLVGTEFFVFMVASDCIREYFKTT